MSERLPLYRRIRRSLYYFLTLLIFKTFQVIPDKTGKAVCRSLVRLAIKIKPEYLELARQNMKLAIPNADQDLLIVDMISRLGDNIHDSLLLPSNLNNLLQSVSCNQDVVDRLQEGGVLILTGHFGCWELLGAWLAETCGGLTVVTGTIHNKPVDDLVNQQRRDRGITPVRRDGDLRPIIGALKSGSAVAVLMDQNNPVENLMIPFFGVPAPTSVGFAKLALKYKVPIIPLSIKRTDFGFNVIAGDLIDINRYYETNDTAGLLKECNLALEKMICSNPAEWVWFHHRWGIN